MRLLQRKTLRIAFQVLGAVLFIVILTRVDLRTVYHSLRRIPVVYLGATLLILVVFTASKSVRWNRIVSLQGFQVPPARAFRVYAASMFAGYLTPGRLGDFVKSFYLTGRGMSAGKAIYSSFLDRVFDLLFLAGIGYVSLLTYPSIFDNQTLITTVIAATAAVCALALFRWRNLLRKTARRFVSAALRGRSGGTVERVLSEMMSEFDTLRPAPVAQMIALSIVAWICHYGVFIVLAAGMGIGAPPHLLIVSVSAAIFTALIPVSISGLGTRDLVLILIFERAGLSKESAIAFSLCFILVYIIQGFIGFLCWLAAPISRAEENGRAV